MLLYSWKYTVASLSGVGVARRVLSRGLLGWLSRTRFGVLLFGHTLSETWGSFHAPTGSLTARVLMNGGSALPQVSTSLSRPSSVVTWDRESTLIPAHLSRAPRPDCDLPPRPLPGVSPSRRKACLSRRLVYCS